MKMDQILHYEVRKLFCLLKQNCRHATLLIIDYNLL